MPSSLTPHKDLVASGSGTVVPTSDNPYNLSGLNPFTAYEFYVLQNCGGGLFSDWVGAQAFTTTAKFDILMCHTYGDRISYSDLLMALAALPASDGTPTSGGLLRVTDPDTGDWTFYTKDETDTLYELTLTKGAAGIPGPSGLWVPSMYNPGP